QIPPLCKGRQGRVESRISTSPSPPYKGGAGAFQKLSVESESFSRDPVHGEFLHDDLASLRSHPSPQGGILKQFHQRLTQGDRVFRRNQKTIDPIFNDRTAARYIGGDHGSRAGGRFQQHLRKSFAVGRQDDNL